MPALAKHIAMPPPMVPAPITAARLISRGFTSFGRSGNFRRLALGKENMPLRFRLVARAQPHEGLALAFQRVVERHVDRRAQHLDRGHRRIEAARAFGMARR